MRGIYVERWIRTDFERLWNRTQSAPAHVRWDARFSQIVYLPRTLDGPERDRYVRKLPLGLRVSGVVEKTGAVSSENGSRTTKIAFYSDGGLSLIESGTGYWRYIPMDDGFRFISYFEYATRFGPLGRVLDLVFKPFFGRETARSIDALALWLEDGVEPEIGRKRARAHRCLRRPSR